MINYATVKFLDIFCDFFKVLEFYVQVIFICLAN